MNSKNVFITQAAIIAAIYTVLVLVFQFTSFGPVQFRVAEALTILPYFTPAAIPGLSIGCILANLLSGAPLIDIVFGSLATFIAALLSYGLRDYRYLVPIPPIVVNALVIPWIQRYAYFAEGSIPFMIVMIGVGQILSAGVLGLVLLLALDKVKNVVFRN